jgi:hypothetical protein
MFSYQSVLIGRSLLDISLNEYALGEQECSGLRSMHIVFFSPTLSSVHTRRPHTIVNVHIP